MKKIVLLLLTLWFAYAQEGGEGLTQKELVKKIQELEQGIQSSNNLWIRKYTNFENYNRVFAQIQELEKELKKSKRTANTSDNLFKKHQLETQIEALQRQLELLSAYKDNPFRELIQKPEITEVVNVTNPIAIIGGIGFIKQLETQRASLEKKQITLQNAIEMLSQKYEALQEIAKLDKSIKKSRIYQVQSGILELESAQDILKTTIDIYTKESQEIINRISLQIKNQIFKLIYIAIGILFSFGVAITFKVLTHRYIHDNERAYIASKIINFVNISVIILILLFAYLENVTYLVAVLGFASAGLAIAMKDLFMSVLGWLAITIGGSVHVGDRIRVCKDGTTYVGDVLDISVLRITLHEDVTLTSFSENRRAGRIVFIPNNYIFTTMFSNYTHGELKSVWDGIDFFITFDSNIQRACEIASEVALKYSKGYTETTRRQLSKMRNKYSLRKLSVEPKVFSFIATNGMCISVWYQTNSYATLGLRSVISAEIMERILKEPNIMMAYNTTKLIKDGTDGFGNKMADIYPLERD